MILDQNGIYFRMGSTFRSGYGVAPGIHFWMDLLLGGSTSRGIYFWNDMGSLKPVPLAWRVNAGHDSWVVRHQTQNGFRSSCDGDNGRATQRHNSPVENSKTVVTETSPDVNGWDGQHQSRTYVGHCFDTTVVP